MNTLIKRILILSAVLALVGFTIYGFDSTTKDKSFDKPGDDITPPMPTPQVVDVFVVKPGNAGNTLSLVGFTDQGKRFCSCKVGPDNWEIVLPNSVGKKGNTTFSIIAYHSEYGYASGSVNIVESKKKYNVTIRFDGADKRGFDKSDKKF